MVNEKIIPDISDISACLAQRTANSGTSNNVPNDNAGRCADLLLLENKENETVAFSLLKNHLGSLILLRGYKACTTACCERNAKKRS